LLVYFNPIGAEPPFEKSVFHLPKFFPAILDDWINRHSKCGIPVGKKCYPLSKTPEAVF